MAFFGFPLSSRTAITTAIAPSVQTKTRFHPEQSTIPHPPAQGLVQNAIESSSGTPFPSLPPLGAATLKDAPFLTSPSRLAAVKTGTPNNAISFSERPFRFEPPIPVFILSTKLSVGQTGNSVSSSRSSSTSTIRFSLESPRFTSTFRTEIRTTQEQATAAPVPIMSMLDNKDPFADPTSFKLAPTSARARPSRVPSSETNGQNSQVNPFTRTVFIVFGVLGALAIIIAITVIILMQIRKRRLLTLTPTPGRDRPSRRRELNFLPKKPTADSMEVNPSLTPPEQAIVNRATSQRNRLTLNLTNNTSLSDAINGFVNKSRSVSYKIGP